MVPIIQNSSKYFENRNRTIIREAEPKQNLGTQDFWLDFLSVGSLENTNILWQFYRWNIFVKSWNVFWAIAHTNTWIKSSLIIWCGQATLKVESCVLNYFIPAQCLVFAPYKIVLWHASIFLLFYFVTLVLHFQPTLSYFPVSLSNCPSIHSSRPTSFHNHNNSFTLNSNRC